MTRPRSTKPTARRFNPSLRQLEDRVTPALIPSADRGV